MHLHAGSKWRCAQKGMEHAQQTDNRSRPLFRLCTAVPDRLTRSTADRQSTQSSSSGRLAGCPRRCPHTATSPCNTSKSNTIHKMQAVCFEKPRASKPCRKPKAVAVTTPGRPGGQPSTSQLLARVVPTNISCIFLGPHAMHREAARPSRQPSHRMTNLLGTKWTVRRGRPRQRLLGTVAGRGKGAAGSARIISGGRELMGIVHGGAALLLRTP